MSNDLDFATWQAIECARYGITVEEHNKLLELSGKLSAALGRSTYDDMMTLIIQSSAIPAHLLDGDGGNKVTA